MKTSKIWIFWLFIYFSFVCAAYALRAWMTRQGVSEIWGWDYQLFVRQIQDWWWIGYFGFRHPGLGIVCSPIVVLEHVWDGAYLFVMPVVATVTAWLIWKMSGWIGLGVWLALPTTWILAGTPESFPLAQLALVGSVWCVNGGSTVRPLRNKELSLCKSGQETASPFMRTGLVVVGWAVLNAAITLTNGVKPLFGWLVLNWNGLDRKTLVRGGAAVLGLVLLGVGFFYVRTLVTGRGMGAGLEATLSWIPAERNLPRELYGFFIRPVGLYQSLIIYPCTFYAVWKQILAHRTSLLLILISYFAVDVFLHCIVGWGMREPWVFAPHWIWMLPLLIGRGFWYSNNKTCQ